jgi:hypothetical protein
VYTAKIGVYLLNSRAHFCIEMKKGFLTAAILFNAIIVIAQPDKPKGFENSSHDVISGTNIKLIPASKLSIEPIVPKTETPKIILKYETPEFNWNTPKLIQTIDPDKIKEKGIDSIALSNYIRLGGGNNTHLLGELYLSNKPNAKWSYHLNAAQLQAKNKTTLQEFANTRVQLGGARFFNNSSLNASLFYNRDHVAFFAKDSNLKSEGKSTAIDLFNSGKIANTYGVNIDYVSLATIKKPEIKWLNRLSLFNTNTNHDELEVNSILKMLKNHKNVTIWGDLAFTDIQSKQKRDTANFQSTLNQMFVDFKPRVQFIHKQTDLNVQVGLNVTYKNATSSASKTYINPFIYAEKGIKGLEMKVYGSIDGGLMKNSLRRMNEAMPYFADTLKIQNQYEQLNGYIGIKGKISGNSQFSLDFGGNSVSDMLNYTSAKEATKSIYDSLNSMCASYLNVSTVYFRAFAQYNMGESFKILGNLKVTQYTPTVPHMPSFTFSLAAEYSPISTVLIKLGMQGVGTRYNTLMQKSVLLNKYTDLYARLDYRFNGAGRIWIQGSNLLNQNYQTYYGYKAFGLTVMGGISIALF